MENGPLDFNNGWGSNEYTRFSYRKVALKCLHKSQNSVDFLIILAWASGNEKIDDFIRELQLKLNDKNDDIQYGKDGPLNYNNNYYSLIDSLINEVKKYSTSKFCKEFLKIYGISQDPDTNDYILVQESFTWVSGNKKIDDFVQEMQLKINTDEDVVFEWIPYDKFDYIKEASKNNLMTVYSAVWYHDGPLKLKYHKFYHRNYYRDAVALKCLHNSENSIDFLINEAKKYSTKYGPSPILYGISQNPNTNDYILVQNNLMNLVNCLSGNEIVDDFIQEMQLKINDYDDMQKWKDGLLEYDKVKEIHERNPNIVVALKCLHNSQNISNEFLNKIKKFSINKRSNILNIYGISQNPDTKEYIIVLKYAKKGKS
ncbi:unnamed protein product [Rhizophagus irregularis]|nr:unnamed protein product [Rhizophagus irregularis]